MDTAITQNEKYLMNKTANRHRWNLHHWQLVPVVTFTMENPGFESCECLLPKRFCPAEKCFMTVLIDQNEKPNLFRQKGYKNGNYY
jgi:hypothetical protein